MQRPPANELPVHVPISGVLNRTDEIVFALTSTVVYSGGVKWEIEIFKRTPTVTMGSHGFGRPETGPSTSAPFLLGFEWADGTTSSNMPMQNAGGLRHNGGGGGAQHVQVHLFLDHLPPAGPFRIITAWPFFDIPEQQVSFDADLIVDAANQVEQLWELVEITRDTFKDGQPRVAPEDAMLVMPRTGWFGEHFDPTPPPPRLDEHGNPMTYQMFTTDAQGNERPLPPPPQGWRLARTDE